MMLLNRLMTVAALTAMLGWSATAMAQDCPNGNCGNATASQGGNCGGCQGCQGYNDGNCGPRPATPCPDACPSTDCVGAVGPHGHRYLGPVRAGALAAQDHYSPCPAYAYSPAGLDATRMDYWNRQMAQQTSWHGGYNYWRYGQPTALVVPPTAAFQTEYNWGVAQTRSLPIYAQFGRGADGVSGGAQSGMFQNTPYWPSSTRQFGIYPVRGPW